MLQNFLKKLFGNSSPATEPVAAVPLPADFDFPKLLEESKMQTVKIEAIAEPNQPLTASKFLGTPYFPKGKNYPLDEQGQPMLMLAQLNFSEIPRLKNYPTAGILQFFVQPFGGLGSDWENLTEQKNWRVVFHEQVDAAVSQADLPKINTEIKDFWSPVMVECRLQFELAEEFVPASDFRNKHFFPSELLEDDDFWDKYHEEINPTGHKIGGYAHFTQEDPRGLGKFEDYILLLQIDSEDDKVCWGDVGVGNWFIREEDLLRLDFSRVLYNWDCY